MNPGWVLALALLGAPHVTVKDGARVDANAVTRGLEARIGDAADLWTVSIEPSEGGGVRVLGRAPGRGLVDQSVELPEEGSDEERAMIVASTVAFALEQAGTVEQPGEALEPTSEPPPSAEHPPPWWVAVGGSLGLGLGPVDPSGAVALDGGRWFGRHVRASLSMGWAHGREAPLAVHAFQPLVEVDAGTRLGGRVWLGGGLGVGATGAWAFDEARASAWTLRLHLPALLEASLNELLFLRGTAGLDVQTPALNFRGAQRSFRWGIVRPFLGLGIGLRLG